MKVFELINPVISVMSVIIHLISMNYMIFHTVIRCHSLSLKECFNGRYTNN